MQLLDLPLIEQEAIKLLIQGGNETCAVLRKQLDAVEGVNRTETGAGIYVLFELRDGVERLASRASFHIADVYATSAKCDEIGFILFVKDGLIEYLEGYTYSDQYPAYNDCDFTVSIDLAKQGEPESGKNFPDR